MAISESTQRSLALALGTADAANDLIGAIEAPKLAVLPRPLPELPDGFKTLASVYDYLAALDAALRGP